MGAESRGASPGAGLMANGDGRAGTSARELVPRRPRQEVSVTFTPGWSWECGRCGQTRPGSGELPATLGSRSLGPAPAAQGARCLPTLPLLLLSSVPAGPSGLLLSQHPLPWVRSRAGALQGWWGAEAMIPVASTPHPAPAAPKVELRVWRRELPGGTKGSPRRCEAQGAAPSPVPCAPPTRGCGRGPCPAALAPCEQLTLCKYQGPG